MYDCMMYVPGGVAVSCACLRVRLNTYNFHADTGIRDPIPARLFPPGCSELPLGRDGRREDGRTGGRETGDRTKDTSLK